MNLPNHGEGADFEGVDARLIEFCIRNGLYVTSAHDGTHNTGSKHYRGEAIDFCSRGLKPEFVEHLKRDAERHGLTLRDERKRPPGQKVYGGPHWHLEIT